MQKLLEELKMKSYAVGIAKCRISYDTELSSDERKELILFIRDAYAEIKRLQTVLYYKYDVSYSDSAFAHSEYFNFGYFNQKEMI